MFASKDTVWVSANKTARLWWDRANDALKHYVANTLVATFTSTGITFAQPVTFEGAPTFAVGTATASSSAATINALAGKVTSEGLTTAAGAAETITVNNSNVAAGDIVLCSVANGTNTQGVVVCGRVTPGSGSFTVAVENQHASQAFNGTVVVSFSVIKAAA